MILLELEVREYDYLLSLDEFNYYLKKFDDDTGSLLREMYYGVLTNQHDDLYKNKDKLMYKISTACPDLNFKLYEEDEYECYEIWQGGKMIDFKVANHSIYDTSCKETITANAPTKDDLHQYILSRLEQDHPEIYNQYVQSFYKPNEILDESYPRIGYM